MKPEEIPPLVTEFLDHFFADELEVAQKELDFLYGNGFEKPTLDYIKMRRFLVTAVNNLKTLDPSIMEGLLPKIHQDVERLHEYFAEFFKKTRLTKLVYVRDFLPSVPEYKQLQDEVTITEAMKKRFQSIASSTDRELAALPPPKNAEELTYMKQLKGRNVDAIDGLAKAKDKLVIISKQLKEMEEAMSSEFFKQYQEYVDNLREGFNEIINTKSYYFDKLLWQRASQSASIRKFFQQARIEGEFSTKTFIQYYLRNIDVEKSSTSDWHNYLHEVLKVLE